MKHRLKLIFITLGIIIAGLILFRLILTFLPDAKLFLQTISSKEEAILLKQVRSHGVSTGILIVLLICLFSAIPGFPVSVIGIFSGVCYGPVIASFMNIVGVASGNLLTYFLIKKFHLIDKSSNKWVKAISKNKYPKISLTASYMIPVIPSFLVNYSASALNISFKKFLLMIFIGSIPSSILYAFGGDALFKGNTKLLLILVAIVALFGLFTLLFKRNKQVKEIV